MRKNYVARWKRKLDRQQLAYDASVIAAQWALWPMAGLAALIVWIADDKGEPDTRESLR